MSRVRAIRLRVLPALLPAAPQTNAIRLAPDGSAIQQQTGPSGAWVDVISLDVLRLALDNA